MKIVFESWSYACLMSAVLFYLGHENIRLENELKELKFKCVATK